MSQDHHIPMLLIPSEEHTWSIYNAMDNKSSDSILFVPYNNGFSGSSFGWVVTVNEDWTVTLYKPFAMVKEGDGTGDIISIHLPCLFPPHLEDDYDPDGIEYPNLHAFHIVKSLLTADPLAYPNECTLVVIFSDMLELASFRIAKDTTWTRINTYVDENEQKHLPPIDDICHYNNQIYAIDCHGVLRSFDVSTNSCYPTVKLVTRHTRSFISGYADCRYLVKSCEGELLQVQRYEKWREEDGGRETKKFRIFKLDFIKAKWIKKSSLGDVALFLGDNSSISVLASNFIGCQRNTIYFTHDRDYTEGLDIAMICDIGIYNVESKKFKLHYNIDSDVLRKMHKRPPIWVVPTLNTC